jgi:hypothetical protein
MNWDAMIAAAIFSLGFGASMVANSIDRVSASIDGLAQAVRDGNLGRK